MKHPAPTIGITVDVCNGRYQVGSGYARRVTEAGGIPVMLPPMVERVQELLAFCDGIILTGGDDPIMSRWGIAMHPKARPIDPHRQEFELAMLDELDHRPQTCVLGVCLGMQLMGLHRGATLNQHLPDDVPTAAIHWDHGEHLVEGELGSGMVHSHHRQALSDAGGLHVIARASDGVIEAIRDQRRPSMYVGVQWHPERTRDDALGPALFRELVSEASRARRNVEQRGRS